MAEIRGATLMARSLKQQGVEYMFGIVGFPVGPIASAAQREGITYLGMRNEQAASYAAQAASYLTGRPQVCITVSGPGVIHALAGLANAKVNNWPMLLIGGASALHQNGMGAFQEESQVIAATPFAKYAHAVEHVDRIPYYTEQAIRTSLYGRPGPAYLDMPDDIITGTVDEADLQMPPRVPDPPRSQAMPDDVDAAIAALKSADNPLVVVGKGMAWSRAEHEVRDFIERTQLPFLATPMGKGVVPDDHPLSVAASRSYALQNTDLVMLLGARLNWILHFGLPPRYRDDLRVVQLDISPEEIGTNVPVETALIGDGRAIVQQLNEVLERDPWQYPPETTWRSGLASGGEENRAMVQAMAADDSAPMNYFRAFKDIRELMPDGALIVGEGANTMDIGRAEMPNFEARTRLDAGSYGTMGIGAGFAIAAAVVDPSRRVVSVQGDSAFGFSGMEVEVACRYNLPITWVVMNNGGIGGGVVELEPDKPIPPSILGNDNRYDMVIEAFGGKGFHVQTPDELAPALREAHATEGPSVVNVQLDPRARRKPQEFQWHTG
jgi:2-hydroxyacyl-CoA lyase 1